MGLALLSIAAVWSAVVIRGAIRPPPETREEVARILGREVLAYHVADGVPHVLFTDRLREQVYFDHLWQEPFTPHWRWTGAWSTLKYTDEPASLRRASCGGAAAQDCVPYREVFGQINAREIVALELEVGGQCYSYSASYPGFAVHLEESDDKLLKYRFLDGASRILWPTNRSIYEFSCNFAA